MTPIRLFLLKALEALDHHVPYVWGGKDPDPHARGPYAVGGLDCSGFVTHLLHQVGGPDWRATHNTEVLWSVCPHVPEEQAQPGDVVLYRGDKPNGVSHAMLYLGNGLVVGQAWGGPSNTSAEASRAAGCVTKVFPLDYRADRAGFVRLPIPTRST